MTSLESHLLNEKQLLRNKTRQKRSLLSTTDQLIYSYRAFKLLTKLPEILNCNDIAAYIAFDHELALGNIINWIWANNKNCYLPTIYSTKSREMSFVNYCQQTKLYYNKFGIAEPKKTVDSIDINTIDAILLPLTGFDKNCNRLGMGQGYYDRVLSTLTGSDRPILIGMAYDFQQVDIVPTNKFDITLDIIVTDKSYYYTSKY
jgi:5-formyltetrahydrofolate cyclo-ligase